MTDSSDTPAVPDAAAPDLPVAAPVAEAPTDEERAARRTRRRRAGLRWSAAAVVCALAGTGSALAVTAAERTDLPGLATKSDGRYTFAPLVLPPLPSGKPAPKDNRGRHAADLRQLLLPAPVEAGGPATTTGAPAPSASSGPSATAGTSTSPAPTSASAPPATGPADCGALAAEQQDSTRVRALLLQNACRATAAREWTASDGTRTQIRLLSFGSDDEAWSVFVGLRDGMGPRDISTIGTAKSPGWEAISDIAIATLVSGADDAPTARLAYVAAGDIVGVVTMTNPTGVPAAAFRQVATLQSDLLA
ncbi:hypothetical protein [Kitasatospora sp. NPDC056184]|uniref:hypothetical protein n=1 Tax=Kitasatospora sp. NPDC056184 TaxID=3345738 RepID=UPI0035DEC2EE